jgi:hypothetical protein
MDFSRREDRETNYWSPAQSLASGFGIEWRDVIFHVIGQGIRRAQEADDAECQGFFQNL